MELKGNYSILEISSDVEFRMFTVEGRLSAGHCRPCLASLPVEVARFHCKDFKDCLAGSQGRIHELTRVEVKALF